MQPPARCCRASRSLESSRPHAGIAQLVEQRIRNARVGGSSPLPGTRSSAASANACSRRRAWLDQASAAAFHMPWIDEAWATHRDTGLFVSGCVRAMPWVARSCGAGAYEPQMTAWLLANLGKGSQGIFVDVGANLGWFTLQAARHEQVQRVVAIEPDAVKRHIVTGQHQSESVAHAG